MAHRKQDEAGGEIHLTHVLAAIAMLLVAIHSTAARAQTYTVLHAFSGSDGANPWAGLSMDRAGNLYGTAVYGGTRSQSCAEFFGCGSVFRLQHKNSGWIFSTLYQFSGPDGGNPQARAIIGADGTLYSTTSNNGSGDRGNVFRLQPPSRFCNAVSCPWMETVLFSFSTSTGAYPVGNLTFDAAGNLYGTTQSGGLTEYCSGGGCGVVYQLTKSGGVWTENILHAFTDGSDGSAPSSGVIFDHSGNLYGTVPQSSDPAAAYGLVYELSPSGPGWTLNALYNFQAGEDGAYPYAGLIFDAAGNLYGATRNEGSGRGGTVFQLSPSEGSWSLTTLYGFSQGSGYWGPYSTLVMDAAGNLYGTTYSDGAYGWGSVFKLTSSIGGWTYSDLYDFTGQEDGKWPVGTLVLDANGNVYGTTYGGGNIFGCSGDFGCGVVFEITP
jgi:hypothetical protein